MRAGRDLAEQQDAIITGIAIEEVAPAAIERPA
jgi:hypothetical protein